MNSNELQMHGVSLIEPLSVDRRRKPMVRRYIVLAQSADEAVHKLVRYQPSSNDGWLVQYTGSLDPDWVICVGSYAAERAELPPNLPTVAALRS